MDLKGWLEVANHVCPCRRKGWAVLHRNIDFEEQAHETGIRTQDACGDAYVVGPAMERNGAEAGMLPE